MLVTIVAGARPNFIKVAPIIKAIEAAAQEGSNIQYRLVHTGQHFDKKMSNDFFVQLGIPDPDINLECGGGSQAEQTASIMLKFEKELLANRPDIVLVVGDVNSTMACTITAKKLGIDIAHVEAGIRSGDLTMPEEINRLVTDAICDHYFTTSAVANENLRGWKVPESKIHFVGNTMIDTLLQNLHRIQEPDFWNTYNLKEKKYFLATLHRPSNVDDPQKLRSILQSISLSAGSLPVVFPVHPRTRKILNEIELDLPNLILAEPQGYLEFIYLIKNALGVLTDSGGITEEATVLDIPCITLRNSTERPETVTEGTNELIGENHSLVNRYMQQMIRGNWKSGRIPQFWDGNTSARIVSELLLIYTGESVPEQSCQAATI